MHVLYFWLSINVGHFPQGRGGLGSIYVFAAGNGGPQDTCAADGYVNSIYTISVGSAASNGQQSFFDEICSAKMVVAFDSDPYQNSSHVVSVEVNQIVETLADIPNHYCPCLSIYWLQSLAHS